MNVLFLAIPTLIIFSLFTQMSEGATYSVVPFIDKRALGAVSGVVGAGGNAGAVAAGFLFKGSMDWNEVFFVIGIVVAIASLLTFFLRFTPEQEREEKVAFEKANMNVLQEKADQANAALERSLKIISDAEKAK